MKRTFLILLLTTSQFANATITDEVTSVVCAEARGASRKDQILVAQTILNRTKDKYYKGSLRSVINKKRQYARPSRRCSNRKEINEIVEQVLAGRIKDPHNVLFFHTKGRERPYWSKRFRVVVVTPYHVYYTRR